MLDPEHYETVLVIGDIIAAHCPNTAARREFIRACLSADWDEAASMIEGMLAEPWHLKGRQEARLREFYDLLSKLLSESDVLKEAFVNRPWGRRCTTPASGLDGSQTYRPHGRSATKQVT